MSPGSACSFLVMLTVCVVMLTVVESVRNQPRSVGRLLHRRARAVSYEYAVVIDAGSSGSRVRVYRWPDRAGERVETTGIELMEPQLKKKPGLSKLAEDLHAVKGQIRDLIRNASGHVPRDMHQTTPIYFMATAGLRQLAEVKMNDVVRYIDSLMQDTSFNPFRYSSSTNSRILSGEEEGVFAWITVNYLMGAFADNGAGSRDETTGILEMGGASTQIGFLPTGNVLADKFPVRIGRKRYALYVHSYLDYGQDNLVRWLKERLFEDYKKKTPSVPAAPTVPNPCMHQGDRQYQVLHGVNITYEGSGDPEACNQLLERLVFKVEDWQCNPKPCAVGSFYQPTLPPNMTFYAVGAFIHSLTAIDAIDETGVYVPARGKEKAFQYCRKPYSEILVDKRMEEFIRHNCVRGLYTSVLFTRGYGFAPDTDRIIVSDKLNEQSLDWTLGAVLYENVLQTCRVSDYETGVSSMSAASSSTFKFNDHAWLLLHLTLAAVTLLYVK